MLRLRQGPLKAPFLLQGEHASLATLGRRGDGVDLGILVPVHRRPKVNTQAKVHFNDLNLLKIVYTPNFSSYTLNHFIPAFSDNPENRYVSK